MAFVGTRSSGRDGTEYNVRSDTYQVERWVTADKIRPPWKRWGNKWRQLEQFRKPVAAAKPVAPKVSASSTLKAAAPAAAAAKVAAAPPKKQPAAAATVGSMRAAAPSVMPARGNGAGILATAPRAAPTSDGATPGLVDRCDGVARSTDAPSTDASSTVAALPTPRPPLKMSAAISESCDALLAAMTAEEDAAWFAQPVRRRAARPAPRPTAGQSTRPRTVGAALAGCPPLPPPPSPLPPSPSPLGPTRRRTRALTSAQVDVEAVPDYLTVIATPMDYSEVQRKLRSGVYEEGPLRFAADMRLIFANALAYNWDAEQECHRAAKQVAMPPRRGLMPVPAAAMPGPAVLPCPCRPCCHARAGRAAMSVPAVLPCPCWPLPFRVGCCHSASAAAIPCRPCCHGGSTLANPAPAVLSSQHTFSWARARVLIGSCRRAIPPPAAPVCAVHVGPSSVRDPLCHPVAYVRRDWRCDATAGVGRFCTVPPRAARANEFGSGR